LDDWHREFVEFVERTEHSRSRRIDIDRSRAPSFVFRSRHSPFEAALSSGNRLTIAAAIITLGEDIRRATSLANFHGFPACCLPKKKKKKKVKQSATALDKHVRSSVKRHFGQRDDTFAGRAPMYF